MNATPIRMVVFGEQPLAKKGTGTMSATNKVLVMGASGLLGVAAIEKFLSACWEVEG
jgi:hypothetical protein